MLAFNQVTQVSGIIITWLPSWIKTSPITTLRDGDFPFGCLRSQGAAPTCPCCSHRCNYKNRGCLTSPSAAPKPCTGSAQPGELCLGPGAAQLGWDGELCLGSPVVSGAVAACPAPEEGCWPWPAAAPAPVALPVTFTSALEEKVGVKIVLLKKFGASAHFQSELNGNKSAFGKYQCGYYEKKLPTLHATHSWIIRLNKADAQQQKSKHARQRGSFPHFTELGFSFSLEHPC